METLSTARKHQRPARFWLFILVYLLYALGSIAWSELAHSETFTSFGAQNFSEKVSEIGLPVKLLSANQLSVELRSKPGSLPVIEIVQIGDAIERSPFMIEPIERRTR